MFNINYTSQGYKLIFLRTNIAEEEEERKKKNKRVVLQASLEHWGFYQRQLV